MRRLALILITLSAFCLPGRAVPAFSVSAGTDSPVSPEISEKVLRSPASSVSAGTADPVSRKIREEVRRDSAVPVPQEPDTLLTEAARAALGRGLEEYFGALERESVEVKMEESDFIIEACESEEVRRFTALKVYSHFLDSPVMGDEAVAIHLYDKWFATGKVKMGSELELFNAGVFAEFNRHSLIGMEAPPLTLYTPSGEKETVIGEGAEPSSRFKLLYFYDIGCSKCKIETPLLLSALSRHSGWPVDAFFVYVGEDMEKWASFRSSCSRALSSGAVVRHLYDPGMESDFQRLYGVLQTPKMFLVNPDGVIVGRNLDTAALEKIMEGETGGEEYEYGGDEAFALFERLLPKNKRSKDDILAVASDISSLTLQRGDTLSFKRLAGDYLYWLSSLRGGQAKAGLKEFIGSYIYGSGVYTAPSDSLQVLGLAQMLSGLMALCPEGAKIEGYRVPGTLVSARGSREGMFRLSSLRGRPSFIIFYSERCRVCAEELSAADSLSRLPSFRKAKFLLVDVDDILANNPTLGRSLMQGFDLSSTPFLVETDRRGIVRRKYFSLADSSEDIGN